MDAAVPNPSLLRALMPSYTATAVIAGTVLIYSVIYELLQVLVCLFILLYMN